MYEYRDECSLMAIKNLIEEKKKDIEFVEAYDCEGRKLNDDIKEENSLMCKVDTLVNQALIEYDSVFKELVDR